MDRCSEAHALKLETPSSEDVICRVRPVVGRPNDFNVVFVGAGNMMFGKLKSHHDVSFELTLLPRFRRRTLESFIQI